MTWRDRDEQNQFTAAVHDPLRVGTRGAPAPPSFKAGPRAHPIDRFAAKNHYSVHTGHSLLGQTIKM